MDFYNYFVDQKLGFSVIVTLPSGTYEFTKIGKHQFCVVNYVTNHDPFVFSKFCSVLPSIEAASLFDSLKRFEV